MNAFVNISKILEKNPVRRLNLSILLLLTVFFILPGQANVRFDNYSVDDGLPNNIISAVIQDQTGWIWVGSNSGLSRFNGHTFKTYMIGSLDNGDVSSDINCFYEDSRSRLWIGTEEAGLVLYDHIMDSFRYFSFNDSCSNCISSNLVYSIAMDTSGILWLGTENGLNRFDPNTEEFQWFQSDSGRTSSISGNIVQKVYIDRSNKLWIGSTVGLDYLIPGTSEIINIKFQSGSKTDNYETPEVYDIKEDSRGNILVGTYANGLLFIDSKTLRIISNILPEPDYLRSYSVKTILEDQKGNYWLGTRGGIYILDPDKNIITHLVHRANDPESLGHNSVNDIFEDRVGDLWISTRNGISHVTQGKQAFNYYRTDLQDIHAMNDNEIYSIMESRDGNIWFGTESGGINILDKKTGRFSYLTHDENNSNSICSNCIKDIIQDKNGGFWIGTFLGGLDYYDPEKKRFIHYTNNPENNNSISDNRVWALLEDRKGNIWIGTEKGLDRFDPVLKRFFRYGDSIRNNTVQEIFEDRAGNLFFGTAKAGLSIMTTGKEILYYKISVRVIYQDTKGSIWIGSDEYPGLSQFDIKQGIVESYSVADGLPSNQIFGILEDKNSKLWISTGQGLSMFDPESKTFKTFKKEDGIQGNRFYYGSYSNSSTGELYFGGQYGVSSFFPENLSQNRNIPPVQITGLKISNQEVTIGGEFQGKKILEKDISASDKIILNHNHSVLTFEFIALNYINSSKNQYAYILEGFENDWNYVGTDRTATYTNLSPGKYTFRVKGSNNDGLWNEKGTKIDIIVTPPFWGTVWFKLIIIALIILIIYLIISYYLKREMLKNQLVLERTKSKELHKIDLMKFQFFTNISHEIRTPISLIVSPLTRIKNSNLTREQIQSDLEVVYRNALRLGKLIDQLLDYRKLEAGKLKLELSRGNIVSFLENVLFMFNEQSREKKVKLEFFSVLDQIEIYFDADKIEKVLFNLLSNAFKHTPEGGLVSVAVSLSYQMHDNGSDDESFTSGQYVQIVVKDNGTGVPENKKERIFDRFYQGKSDDSGKSYGSGIGLSMSKELIKIHNGKISLKSNPGAGTELTILLPAIKEDPKKKKTENLKVLTTNSLISGDQIMNEQLQESLLDPNIPILLVVEDNCDLLAFIQSIFADEYNVLSAGDGEAGLELAFESIPDIIITDIMMPKMDGKKFCQAVKKDFRTSHIPLMFLTALSSKQHEKEGILLGADEYITKPFDPSLIKMKADQLIATRRLLRQKYSQENILKPIVPGSGSPDDKFLQKLIGIIEDNIADPEFGTVKISREVGVSRTQLYRKMAALTEMTVKEFIRSIRLKKAAQLILSDQLNISEVAYSVGFQQVAYFRKCFKEIYGMTPTEFIKKNSANR